MLGTRPIAGRPKHSKDGGCTASNMFAHSVVHGSKYLLAIAFPDGTPHHKLAMPLDPPWPHDEVFNSRFENCHAIPIIGRCLLNDFMPVTVRLLVDPASQIGHEPYPSCKWPDGFDKISARKCANSEHKRGLQSY